MTQIAVPEGSNTANPFIIADAAKELIEFLITVFGATDVPEARTLDADGLILHAELRIGDSLLTITDRKPDWPFTPAFTRVYVDNVDAVLARAETHGGRIVTKPTEFFGEILGRFQDPSGNLWWVYRHNPHAAADWSGADAADAGTDKTAEDLDANGWENFSTPELDYIHATLVDAMTTLRDPRSA